MVKHYVNGTRNWYENKKDQRIFAFFKNYKTYESIPDWKIMDLGDDNKSIAIVLEHGYDENIPQLNLADLQEAAHFRGGRCLSSEWNGDLYSNMKWQCAFFHQFYAKPFTVLKAGHWCPECVNSLWNGDQQAKKNPFLAQVWHASHDPDEESHYNLEGSDEIANVDVIFKNRKN